MLKEIRRHWSSWSRSRSSLGLSISLAMTGIAQVLFPYQGRGSVITLES
jgi:hypothetical protein